MVEHPDGHVQLLAALRVAHEARDRRVHGESDVVLARELAEALREAVVHPEATLEVDLARGEIPLQQRLDSGLGRLARRDARGAEMQVTRHRQPSVPVSVRSSSYPEFRCPTSPPASTCSSSIS